MKIVGVVPMKLNNHRLPGKNTRAFTNGRSLCCYILDTLLSIPEIDRVYVYCSSSQIRDVIPPEVKFLIRPESLDQDSTTMNEVLRVFAAEVLADIYVMAHATALFISCGSIRKGLKSVVSGFYIYLTNVIGRLNRRIGDKAYILEVSGIEGIDIDEEEDFMIADAVFNYILNDRGRVSSGGIVTHPVTVPLHGGMAA